MTLITQGLMVRLPIERWVVRPCDRHDVIDDERGNGPAFISTPTVVRLSGFPWMIAAAWIVQKEDAAIRSPARAVASRRGTPSTEVSGPPALITL
jgi:hypothetical protein